MENLHFEEFCKLGREFIQLATIGELAPINVIGGANALKGMWTARADWTPAEVLASETYLGAITRHELTAFQQLKTDLILDSIDPSWAE